MFNPDFFGARMPLSKRDHTRIERQRSEDLEQVVALRSYLK